VYKTFFHRLAFKRRFWIWRRGKNHFYKRTAFLTQVNYRDRQKTDNFQRSQKNSLIIVLGLILFSQPTDFLRVMAYWFAQTGCYKLYHDINLLNTNQLNKVHLNQTCNPYLTNWW